MAPRRVRKRFDGPRGGGPVAASSWQVRNPAYSRVAIAVSIAAVIFAVALMVMR